MGKLSTLHGFTKGVSVFLSTIRLMCNQGATKLPKWQKSQTALRYMPEIKLVGSFFSIRLAIHYFKWLKMFHNTMNRRELNCRVVNIGNSIGKRARLS